MFVNIMLHFHHQFSRVSAVNVDFYELQMDNLFVSRLCFHGLMNSGEIESIQENKCCNFFLPTSRMSYPNKWSNDKEVKCKKISKLWGNMCLVFIMMQILNYISQILIATCKMLHTYCSSIDLPQDKGTIKRSTGY